MTYRGFLFIRYSLNNKKTANHKIIQAGFRLKKENSRQTVKLSKPRT